MDNHAKNPVCEKERVSGSVLRGGGEVKSYYLSHLCCSMSINHGHFYFYC